MVLAKSNNIGNYPSGLSIFTNPPIFDSMKRMLLK